MIINVPSAEDYYTSGKELLNFAWQSTATLLIEFDQAGYYGLDEAEISDAYWAAAKRTLTTSLTVVQQATEIIIKGRIVAISPYLLLSDSPSRWPSPYEGKPIDFEKFRTIDAQDLIRVHDTFAPTAFAREFVDRFHRLRELRNTVMHSAGKNVSVPVAEVVDNALYMHKALFPTENWFTVRREFLLNAPSSHLGDADYATNFTCWEAEIVKKLLRPAQVAAYLGVDKKQRPYLCPSCLDAANTDNGFNHKLAVLMPASPTSTALYCPVCNQTSTVIREDCGQTECRGNVIDDDSGRCLTCSAW